MKTENITFEDYLFNKCFKEPLTEEEKEQAIKHVLILHENYINCAIEFAKIIAKNALKEASEKATMKMLIDEENDIIQEASIDKDSILNAYDLTQIK